MMTASWLSNVTTNPQVRQIAVGFSIGILTALMTYVGMRWMIRGITPSLSPATMPFYCLSIAGAIAAAQCSATLAVSLFGLRKAEADESGSKAALRSILLSMKGASIVAAVVIVPLLLWTLLSGVALFFLSGLSAINASNPEAAVTQIRLNVLYRVAIFGMGLMLIGLLFALLSGGQIGWCLHLRTRTQHPWRQLGFLALIPGNALILSLTACLSAEWVQQYLKAPLG